MLLVVIVMAYLTGHYLFTLATLYDPQKGVLPKSDQAVYEPAILVMIPAHNEEHVIERILQRMIELTYPKEKI
jgi:cellulose synthase/poly-beta-1,6-N-acetylglucosamine synthase-like glycosyltransferase